MFSLFPEILFLAPFSATLIRLAVGIAFIGIAWRMNADAHEMARIRLPIIGQPSTSLMYLAGGIIGIVGLALVVGIYTQLMALFGVGITLVRLALGRRYDAVCPLVYSTQAFLLIMCLSLLVTGPGPIAFDLPL